MDDATLFTYLKHKISLQHKLQNKRKAKAIPSTPVPVHDVADTVPSPDRSMSPVPPLFPADLAVTDPVSLDWVKGDILSQFTGLFDFCEVPGGSFYEH